MNNTENKKTSTPTAKGTIPNKPNRSKKNRIKPTKKKIVKTDLDRAEDKIRSKVFSKKDLSWIEKNLLLSITKKFIENNKKYIKNSWDIELSSLLSMDDTPTKYFLIKARINKKVDFNWIASEVAQAHIQAIFNESDVIVTLFKSKKVWIETDLESMTLSLKYLRKGQVIGNKHIKKYTLEDLPLFK